MTKQTSSLRAIRDKWNICAAVVLISTLLLGSVAITPAFTAEYCGSDIDGILFACDAFSYSSGHYYEVIAEFDGDEVVITFDSGGRVRLSIDDSAIDDPQSISAYDYRRGTFWDLAISDLDDCSDY